jgi:uncharacterized protein HemX
MTALLTPKRLALGALILALILLGGYSYALFQKNVRLEANARALQEANSSLRQSLARQYSEAAARDLEAAKLRADRLEEDKTYEDLKKTDPEACSWSESPLPGAVIDFLCQGP